MGNIDKALELVSECVKQFPDFFKFPVIKA